MYGYVRDRRYAMQMHRHWRQHRSRTEALRTRVHVSNIVEGPKPSDLIAQIAVCTQSMEKHRTKLTPRPHTR